jgi:threonine/homoserine/homoserine lactone efflux protein
MLGFLAIFWTSFLIGFSGALVPGPTLTVTVREAAKRGARAGPLVVLGHGLTEVAVTVALILGASSFMGDIRVRKTIAIVGGALLAWMGLSMLRKFRSIDKEMTSGNKAAVGGRSAPILLGVTTTLSNPYWFGWWGSIGATLLVSSSSLGPRGIVAFVTGHISSDLLWYSIVSYLVSLGLSYSRGAWYRIVFAVCGAFLLVVAAMFIRYGMKLTGVQ